MFLRRAAAHGGTAAACGGPAAGWGAAACLPAAARAEVLPLRRRFEPALWVRPPAAMQLWHKTPPAGGYAYLKVSWVSL